MISRCTGTKYPCVGSRANIREDKGRSGGTQKKN